MAKIKISERDLQDALITALEDGGLELSTDDGEDFTIDGARTFRDMGILSSNKGIVITLSNGAVFQLTIVKDDRAVEEISGDEDEDEDEDEGEGEGEDASA